MPLILGRAVLTGELAITFLVVAVIIELLPAVFVPVISTRRYLPIASAPTVYSRFDGAPSELHSRGIELPVRDLLSRLVQASQLKLIVGVGEPLQVSPVTAALLPTLNSVVTPGLPLTLGGVSGSGPASTD